MTKRFLIFGCLGWCIEILWTGFHSLLLGDGALTAKTYLWMFPIYGAAAFASPLFLAVRKSCPLWQRLGLYSVTIFLVEFAAGGLIRLDYAPLWAALGCFFEEVSLLLAKKGELA